MMNKRIGYIDAMRGFTMILVVYSHICHFCLGDSLLGFNATFFLFRLPCFFFISGWLFEPVSRRPFRQIARKKFMVQIVPTAIFLLLLAPPPEFFHQLGTLKGGYWFTFTLFEFFLIYMLSIRYSGRWSWLLVLTISIVSFCFGSYQNHLRLMAPEHNYLSLLLDIAGFLGIRVWQYYLFFYVGTLVRCHFDAFIKLTNKPRVVMLLIVTFFAIASTAHPASAVLEYLRFNLGGISGMLMVFTAFRFLYSFSPRHSFPLSAIRHHTSSFIKFVGTRTLDVYLLHYFFLPRFLLSNTTDVIPTIPSLLLPFVIFLLSLVVVAFCLATSYIIRLSPFWGHYLFGVKYERV